MKKIIKASRKWLMALALCCTLTAMSSLINPAYADDDVVSSGGITSADDITISSSYDTADNIEQKVTEVLGGFEKNLVNIAIAAFPVAGILAVLGLLFAKDSRKIAGIITGIVMAIIAFAMIILFYTGTIQNFILNLLR